MTPWRSANCVRPGLFLGCSAIATQTRWIKEHHITHTVSFDPDEGPGLAPCSAPNRLHISVEDDDSADLLMWLLPACQFIHGVISAGGIVLVHSRMGQSRSSAVVAAYLMCTEGLSVAAAQQSVRDAREQIWIRPSLVEQLVVFELCQFQPRTDHPMYAKWRASRDLAAIAGQLSAYEK